MNLKIIFFFLGLLTATTLSLDLAAVRAKYREASNDKEVVKKLHHQLISISKNDTPTLIAYKGAVTTMMADHAQGIKDKKRYFKEGKELLEYAIETEPENVEIRCIRLSVQENAPKITGYRKNIGEDKAFILDNFATMSDKGAKAFVKEYAAQSQTFTDTEKQLF